MTVTLVSGCAVSSTVKVSVPPSSLTDVEPADSVRRIPGASVSVVVTETFWALTTSNGSYEAPASTETVTVVVWSPSASGASGIPVTTTACGESQLPFVKVSVAGVTVASPVSPLTTLNTTFSVG